jgi:hypothetical protein
MPTILPLDKMSREEKLRAMEELWADLSQNDDFESPAWHAEELEKTRKRIREGEAKFSNWEEAKERMRRRAAAKS